jgi:hypothetical protein
LKRGDLALSMSPGGVVAVEIEGERRVAAE